MWRRRLTEPGKQFRDVKNKILGISRPPAPIYTNESSNSWNEADTSRYLRQTRASAQAIITDSNEMTDSNQTPLKSPTIRGTWAKFDRSLVQYSSLGLPLMSSTDSIEAHLRKLTAFSYAPQETTTIVQWIYRSSKSPQIHSQMSTQSFNYLVGFALKSNDIHLALYITEIMKSHHHTWPDRTTLHLFLDFNAALVAANPYPRPMSGHPSINTQSSLRRMRSFGVKADRSTWNLVMQCMPFGFGKSFVLEEMDKRGITLEDSAKKTLYETILNDRKDIDTSQLDGLVDWKDPIAFQLLIDHLLTHKKADNANVVRAWSLLAKQQDRSPEMMNVFLRRFAARRHLDWQLGIMSFFETTSWNSESWEFSLEAASFINDNAAKPVISGTILKQAEHEDVPLTVRSRYLARRAARLPLKDFGREGWNEIVKGLKWSDALQPKNPDLLTAIGFSEHGKDLPSTPVTLDHTRFSAMPRTDSAISRNALVKQLSECT